MLFASRIHKWGIFTNLLFVISLAWSCGPVQSITSIFCLDTFWIFRESHCFINGLVRCLEVGDTVSKVSPSGKQPSPGVQYDNLERSLSQASNTLSPFPAIAFNTNIQSEIAINCPLNYLFYCFAHLSYRKSLQFSQSYEMKCIQCSKLCSIFADLLNISHS